MEIVILTALGVGGATVAGAALGFVFRGMADKYGEVMMSFAAGVMLAASIVGLILPSLEYGNSLAVLITGVGIFVGAVTVHILDSLVVVRFKERIGADTQRVMLLALAIAIHNIPEGIAAGVGFGSGNTSDALLIAGAIALQNIPEGMVLVSPMLSVGISPGKTFLFAMITGLTEVLGTFIGYFAISLASVMLPFLLAFAGGAMLYVISREMMPEDRSNSASIYALLFGFVLMISLDALLG